MRIGLTVVTAACVLAAGVATSHGHAFAASSGVTAAVTGAGDVNVGDGLRTFSFSATASDSRASGQAQVDNRARDTTAHVAVSCLVVSGNVGYVGGIVTSSTNPNLVGAPVLFAVQDNGQGASAPADQITGLFVGDSDCANADNQAGLAQSLFPIQQGDVQVH
jgi:hypothetical protein